MNSGLPVLAAMFATLCYTYLTVTNTNHSLKPKRELYTSVLIHFRSIMDSAGKKKKRQNRVASMRKCHSYHKQCGGLGNAQQSQTKFTVMFSVAALHCLGMTLQKNIKFYLC